MLFKGRVLVIFFLFHNDAFLGLAHLEIVLVHYFILVFIFFLFMKHALN